LKRDEIALTSRMKDSTAGERETAAFGVSRRHHDHFNLGMADQQFGDHQSPQATILAVGAGRERFAPIKAAGFAHPDDLHAPAITAQLTGRLALIAGAVRTFIESHLMP
jgi:hypothetical protein